MVGQARVVTGFERRQRGVDLSEEDARRERLAEEARRTSEPFTQLYDRAIPYLTKLAGENPFALQIFLFMIEKMDRRNSLICPVAVLCDVFKKSRVHVSRTIAYLRDKKIVYVTRAGNMNVFHLNPEIVWKSYENHKEYCEFEGKILIAKSENPELELEVKKYKKLEKGEH